MNLTSIDLNHLRVFQRVVQERSFSRAAAALELDRARVSRIISSLEAALGARLLVRTTRSVRPTPEGEALAREVENPLGELERVVSAVPTRRDVPRGEVTLTATVDLGRGLLAPRLPRFRARFPEVSLRLVLSDELLGFASGVDLALRVGRAGGQSVVARRLRRLDTGFFAAPSYLGRRGTPGRLGDLASHDGLWPMVRGPRSFAPGKRPPPPAVACGDFATLAELAAAGGGIAMLPTFVAEPYLARGELLRVLPDATVGSAPLYLVSAPPAQLPARVAVLRAFLLAELAG
ncbi:MAG: LysR family transcriptional regulator [Kofleriaceae bacterium]